MRRRDGRRQLCGTTVSRVGEWAPLSGPAPAMIVVPDAGRLAFHQSEKT